MMCIVMDRLSETMVLLYVECINVCRDLALTIWIETEVAAFSFAVQAPHGECATFGKAYALFLEQSGFLSSWVATNVGPGQASCPWEIHTTSDKVINLTLHDFGLRKLDLNHRAGGCQRLLTIEEIEHELPSGQVTVCSGSQRRRHIFLSAGRKVKVTFHHDPYYGNFLLEYNCELIFLFRISALMQAIYIIAMV